MRFPVRVFLRCVSSFLIFFLLLQLFASSVFAQTQQITSPQQHTYTRPNVEDNVPLNQHTYMQSMLLEFMLAIECQITGIDVTRQGQSCLGINPASGKLGYAPSEAGQVPRSSVLGMLTQSISGMYVPVAGSQDYFKYVASNFGIVKTAMAAPATGFEGLAPVLELWKATRDVAYYVLIIAFIFIGIGVMLRVHIDPRTVMTVQNQIPRVIICIILITFSYAIAGLLIDVMWSVTYMGINTLTASTDPHLNGCSALGVPSSTLSHAATSNILESPLTFFNQTFVEPGCNVGGILDLSQKVGNSVNVIQQRFLKDLLSLDCDFSWYDAIPLVGIVDGNLVSCGLDVGLRTFIGWAIAVAYILIALIIILISLIRIWFSLLRAYAFTFMYVVLGPLWIVMGLLPKKPLGFEKWIRTMFANLAVFPATALLIVFARILSDKFNAHPQNIFVPPLVADPGAGQLGGLIAFAILLATPSILDTLREKLGVPPSKAFQGAVQTFNTGRRAPGAIGKKAWSGLYRINPTTGAAESALAIGAQQLKGWGKKKVLGPKGWLGYEGDPDKEPTWKKFLRESSERKDNLRKGYQYHTDEQLSPGSRMRAWAQPQVDGIIGTAADPKIKYSDKDWATLHSLDERGGISDSQRKIMADSILARTPSDWSTHDRDFINAQRQNNALSPLQEGNYQKSIAGTAGAATSGAPQTTTFNVTVNSTMTPVGIPSGAGQTVGSVIGSLSSPAKDAWNNNPNNLQALDTLLIDRLTDSQKGLFETYLGEQMKAGTITPTQFGGTGGTGTASGSTTP